MIDRRAFLRGLGLAGIGAATAALSVGCSRAAGEPGVLRVGALPNLTHGPLLTGLASGRFATAMAATSIESRTFRAGPRVAEALVGRAIDVGVCGPMPVLSVHARHEGSPLIVLAGCASGGASLVTSSAISDVAELRGKRVATPQIGSTQDVSLRTYLRAHGLESEDHGGDVAIDALASADIFVQMQRGAIAAAWLPEPWATRVVRQLPGRRLVDERDLWPERRFPAAVLVVRREFYEARKDEVQRLLTALLAEVERFSATPEGRADQQRLVADEVARLTTKRIPQAIMDEAWQQVDVGSDPYPRAMEQIARDACALGYLPQASCEGLFRLAS